MTRDEAQALLDTVPLHANLGIEMDRYDEGHVTFRFTPPSAARSPDGIVHGGVLATALDTAATFAVISSLGHDASTVDIRIDYLRPATGETFRVEGRTIRSGSRLARADAEIMDTSDRVVATGRGAFIW